MRSGIRTKAWKKLADLDIQRSEQRAGLSEEEREAWYEQHPDDRFLDAMLELARRYGGNQ